MRRYTIVVNGKTHALDVRELTADRFEVVCGERRLDVELVDSTEIPEGGVSEAAEVLGRLPGAVGAAAPVSASFPRTAGVTPEERVAASPIPVPPPPPARPSLRGTTSIAPSATLTAPMPGLIVSIAVAAGARVKRGDTLLTLEAMKMANPIRAPRDGVVAELAVAVGATVGFGDILLRFAE